MKKKGVSPIIATVILIAIVIILAVIIFLWARGFVEERAQKFGRAVELSCEEVNFEAGVFCDGSEGCILEMINRGNVPVYGVEIKHVGSASVEIKDTLSTEFGNPGDSATILLGSTFLSGDEILIVPVILGESDSGKVAYTCPDETGFATFVP